MNKNEKLILKLILGKIDSIDLNNKEEIIKELTDIFQTIANMLK